MQTNKTTNGTTKKLLIEIIEDDLIYLKTLNDQLSRNGFEIVEAKNGKTGLELAKSRHPDLILLNIQIPTMDGMTMLNELRKDAYGKTVSVIVLTNLEPTDQIIKHIIEYRPSYYFIKADITFTDLLKRMEELLFPQNALQ